MENISFNSNDLNPIFIFEYYDTALAFISNKINDTYYFFYFIDDNQYFMKPLSAKEINMIFSSHYIRDFFNSFLECDDFRVINFLSELDAVLYTIPEFEKTILGESIECCLPDEDQVFEYDFVNKISFNDLKDIYKNSFPELYNHKQLTIKLRDEQNSHSAKPSIVLKAIEWIETYISEKKDFLSFDSIFPNEKLTLLPFSPGSFNINFSLTLPREVSVFEDYELNFDDFITFVDSIDKNSAETLYEEFLYESPKVVKATNEFYKDMKKSNVEIELLDNDQRLASIVASPKVDEMMEKLHSISKSRELGREKREILQFSGEVRSASKIRNTVSIGLAGENISAKFTTKLFKDIKDSIKSVAVSKEITGEWEKISIIDDNSVEISSKYIIISFEQ